MRIILSAFAALLLLTFMPHARAEGDAVPGFRSTELPLPRFVSLKNDPVYVRAGPGRRYPIEWVYHRRSMPVEITQEYEQWRKIRDIEGDEGWISATMLSNDRTAIVEGTDPVPLMEKADHSSRLVARSEPGVIFAVRKCVESMCRVEGHGFGGWVDRSTLWGIYADEDFD